MGLQNFLPTAKNTTPKLQTSQRKSQQISQGLCGSASMSEAEPRPATDTALPVCRPGSSQSPRLATATAEGPLRSPREPGSTRGRGRAGPALGAGCRAERCRRRGAAPSRRRKDAGTGGRATARRLSAPGKRCPAAENRARRAAHLPALFIFHRNFACRLLTAWSRGPPPSPLADAPALEPLWGHGHGAGGAAGSGAGSGRSAPRLRPAPRAARRGRGRRDPVRPAARGAGPGGAGTTPRPQRWGARRPRVPEGAAL